MAQDTIYKAPRLLAVQGGKDDLKVMQHAMLERYTLAKVAVIDTNHALSLQHFSKSALKNMLLARPYTAEELISLTKKLDPSTTRMLIITSLDHLFCDVALSCEDALLLLEGLMQNLKLLTELHSLQILIGLSEPPNPRSAIIQESIKRKVDFTTLL